MAPVKALSIFLVFLLTVVLGLISCESNNQTRPFGYMRIGKVDQLLSGQIDLSKFWLHLLKDDTGIRIISTLCTFDLEPLKHTDGDEGGFVCPRCGSRFSETGERISGKAVVRLPSYQLELAPATYGAPVSDTIYVKVGIEKDPQERFKVE